MKRFLKVIVIIVLGLAAGLAVFIFLPRKTIVVENENCAASFGFLEQELNRKEDSKIILFAVGDIMLNRGVEYMIQKEGNNDFRFPFLKIGDYLQKADILFGNLESVISDKGTRMGSIYSFRAEPEAIEALTYAAFDIVSVANNHIFDYGREAMEDSFERLNRVGIDYVGAGFNEQEARSGVIKEIKDTRILFLGYTNRGSEYWEAQKDRSGIAWLDQEIAEDIKRAEEKADLIIVSFHTGDEYQTEPSEEQKKFAYLAVDSGADLVIGHHPHALQPLEKYKNGWIAYSLGNFIFDQNFSEETAEGGLLEVLIEDKKIKEVIQREIKISKNFQPYLE